MCGNVGTNDDQQSGPKPPYRRDFQGLTQDVLVAGNPNPALLGDLTKPHGIGRSVVPEVVVMPNDGQAGFLERVREYPVAQIAIDEIDRSQAARS